MRQDFDWDPTKPNPYEEPETCKPPSSFLTFSLLIYVVVTMEQLRRELDKEEAREFSRGHTSPHAVTASTFMGNALRLEEQQYVLPPMVLNETTDPHFRRNIRSKEKDAIRAGAVAGGSTERRKSLVKSIREFRTIQKVYMPGLSSLLDNADDDSRLDTNPELFKLMLPSQLSPDDRQPWCLPGIPSLEARFRYAQADDALAELRRLRQLFQGLSVQNRKHISTSQNTGGRAKGTFDRYQALITQTAMIYRHARRALIALDPNGEIKGWTSRFLELKDADISGPGKDPDDNNPSYGRTVSSWIWLVPKSPHSLDGSDPDNSNAAANSDESDLSQRAASGEEIAISIRAHWARCQARAERYEEEVSLTLEEMRRTLEFFKWKSRWWLELQDKRATSANPPDPQVQHGLRAYAHRQASTYSSLTWTYVNHWRTFLVENSLGLDWLSLYPTEQASTTEPISAARVDDPLEDDEEDDEEEDQSDAEEPADPEIEEIYADFPGN